MEKRLFYSIWLPLSLLVLLSIANAGTVTLSGSCQNYLVNNSIVFSLSNSGNDSAYNLLLSPLIFGAKPVNSTYPILQLKPGETVTTYFRLTNFTLNGTYADAVIVSYQMGFSAFTAIFPCMVSIGRATVSPVYENVNVNNSGGVSVVNVALFNGGPNTVNGSLFLFTPPTFSYISSKAYNFTLGPYTSKNFTFKLNIPNTGSASYSSAAVASFAINKLHYASMTTFAINIAAAVSTGKKINILEVVLIGVSVIIVLLLILMFRSFRKKTKNKS